MRKSQATRVSAWFQMTNRIEAGTSDCRLPTEGLRRLLRGTQAASGKRRATHEVLIAFARGAPAFVDGPNYKALTASHVAGREDAGHICCVTLRGSPHIRSSIPLNSQLVEQQAFGPQKSHCDQHELSRVRLPGPGQLPARRSAVAIPQPLDLDRLQPCNMAIIKIADETLRLN
jgi:hypothetical protein